MAKLFVIEDFLRRALEHDLARVEDDRPVGQLQCRHGILLDDDRSDAGLFHFLQDLLDFLDDRRRKAFVGLVQQKELDIPGEGAGHRQHLLFATGKRHSFLLPPLGQPREVMIDPVEFPADRLGDLRQDEVFLHCEALDDTAVFRHELDAGASCLIVPHLVDRHAVEPDLTSLQTRRIGSRDRPKRRCFARAVAPEQRYDLARRDIERNPLNDVALAVVGVDVPAGQIRHGCRRSGGSGQRHTCSPPR